MKISKKFFGKFFEMGVIFRKGTPFLEIDKKYIC